MLSFFLCLLFYVNIGKVFFLTYFHIYSQFLQKNFNWFQSCHGIHSLQAGSERRIESIKLQKTRVPNFQFFILVWRGYLLLGREGAWCLRRGPLKYHKLGYARWNSMNIKCHTKFGLPDNSRFGALDLELGLSYFPHVHLE